MKIDNFALTMFQACPIKYHLRMREGWTIRHKSAALGFGGSIHVGLATWYRSGSARDSLLAINDAWPDGLPVDDYRTKQKCVEVMIAYMKEYPSETFRPVIGPDGPLIEVAFTLPTGLFLRCQECLSADESARTETHCSNCGEAKEEIEYGGITDGLVEFSEAVYVLEHKSTSQLGPSYFNQFRPNNQVTGYVWGAGELSGKRVGGTLINAIGVYKASATKFERQITMRDKEEIDEWKISLHATCEQIKHCERTGIWPLHTVACTMYGRCEFHAIHELPQEKQRTALLEQDYIRKPWDYEARDD